MSLRELMEQATDSMTVRRVFGDPLEREGVWVVPVANVRGGGGGGGGEQAEQRGWGGGFGVSATPAGVYVIRGDEVEWRPAVDANRIVFFAGIAALLMVRALTRRRRRL